MAVTLVLKLADSKRTHLEARTTHLTAYHLIDLPVYMCPSTGHHHYLDPVMCGKEAMAA